MRSTLFIAALFAGVLATQQSSATLHIIQVGPNNTQTFSPATVTAAIGDTIKWVWGGTDLHTTTSDGIPTGAAAWDDTIDVSRPSFTYVPTKIGVYNYHCTPHASMGMTGTFTVTFPASVNNIAADEKIVLSPNPASGTLTIQVGRDASVDLMDLSGKLVRHMQPVSSSATEQHYMVDDLATGTYLLNIKTGVASTAKKLQIVR